GWARGLTGMRRTVALRMAESAALVAPVTLQRDLDVTDLTAWATRRPPQAPGGVLDALLALVARALVRHPDLNAHLLDTGIVEHDAVHLGYAVDGARGLVVPVVRDAAGLPVDELAERRRALVTAARAGKLGPDDQDGATFTVTNLGPLGIDHFSPIVNLPQVAILGLGAFRSTLDVGDDDTPVVRRKVGVSLTFDHRAVDGAPAARFLDRLARTAADPFELLA
ncbi:MAG TPA: 2-oxo acid dehydrogenase subunit E2, partial [Acidimicrobiales bacterium]